MEAERSGLLIVGIREVAEQVWLVVALPTGFEPVY